MLVRASVELENNKMKTIWAGKVASERIGIWDFFYGLNKGLKSQKRTSVKIQTYQAWSGPRAKGGVDFVRKE